jgi:hypothetical protein
VCGHFNHLDRSRTDHRVHRPAVRRTAQDCGAPGPGMDVVAPDTGIAGETYGWRGPRPQQAPPGRRTLRRRTAAEQQLARTRENVLAAVEQPLSSVSGHKPGEGPDLRVAHRRGMDGGGQAGSEDRRRLPRPSGLAYDATPDRFGFPRLRRSRVKQHFGYVTGDLVRATVPSDRWAGTWTGRISVRSRGSTPSRHRQVGSASPTRTSGSCSGATGTGTPPGENPWGPRLEKPVEPRPIGF